MFKIYNAQRIKMAIPFIENIIRRAIVILKEDYPVIYKKQNFENLDAQLRLLISDKIGSSFTQNESVINYLIMCIKHGINYQYIMQDKYLASILGNNELQEGEKLYLIDEKLYYP